uniref:Ovule protein n=1 Tax=Rodentolepis nana TaxID=102285 RepID=A0A0R3T4V6_RODNA
LQHLRRHFPFQQWQRVHCLNQEGRSSISDSHCTIQRNL